MTTLSFAWKIRCRLWAEGDKLHAEGSKLHAEGSKGCILETGEEFLND
jgi:hypothetical protein